MRRSYFALRSGYKICQRNRNSIIFGGILGLGLFEVFKKPADLSEYNQFSTIVNNSFWNYQSFYQHKSIIGSINMSSNMAIVKLVRSGDLILYNPVALTDDLKRLLAQVEQNHNIYLILPLEDRINPHYVEYLEFIQSLRQQSKISAKATSVINGEVLGDVGDPLELMVQDPAYNTATFLNSSNIASDTGTASGTLPKGNMFICGSAKLYSNLKNYLEHFPDEIVQEFDQIRLLGIPVYSPYFSLILISLISYDII